jgi:hypothetical protein
MVQIRLADDPHWVTPRILSNYAQRRDARIAMQNEATRKGVSETREVLPSIHRI